MNDQTEMKLALCPFCGCEVGWREDRRDWMLHPKNIDCALSYHCWRAVDWNRRSHVETVKTLKKVRDEFADKYCFKDWHQKERDFLDFIDAKITELKKENNRP